MNAGPELLRWRYETWLAAPWWATMAGAEGFPGEAAVCEERATAEERKRAERWRRASAAVKGM